MKLALAPDRFVWIGRRRGLGVQKLNSVTELIRKRHGGYSPRSACGPEMQLRFGS